MLSIVLIGLFAIALGQDCAQLPASAEFWSLTNGGTVQNNAEGSLVLSYDATDSLVSSYGTLFAEAQDLTQHSVVSFNLYKVHQPVRVFLSISTPHGEHRTDVADLFEGVNTITVDLASNEFASDAEATVFNQPIVGLSQVSAIRLHLIASELGHGEATVDSMMVCAHDVESASTESAVDASEPAALDLDQLLADVQAAVAEVTTLRAEVEDLRTEQHKIERTFQEFGVRSHTTLDKAVDALSDAMQANVDQTLSQARLFKNLRENVRTTMEEHAEQIQQLQATHEALQGVAQLRPGEQYSDLVARVNAQEANENIEQIALQKRAIVDAAVEAVERPVSAVAPVKDAFHIEANNNNSAKKNVRPSVPGRK